MARRMGRSIQRELSGLTFSKNGKRGAPENRERIPLKSLLANFQTAEGRPGLIEIYRTEVLPIKTRTLHLLGRKCSAKIIHTLLGYEVQASYKRIQCPDFATARYLRLFTELGCRIIRLPYDFTVTARIIPGMEASVQHLNKGVSRMFPQQRSVQLYAIQKLYDLMRKELHSLGSRYFLPSQAPEIGD